MDKKLVLRMGGVLELHNNKFNPETQNYDLTVTDVTKNALYHLNDYCEIEDGFTLRDLCKTIYSNDTIGLYEIIFRNWIDEFVEYIFNLPVSDKEKTGYLELRWFTTDDIQFGNNYIDGLDYPELHYMDFPYDHSDIFDKDKMISHGIAVIDDLVDRPLKLNENFNIYVDDYPNSKNILTDNKKRTFTLYQIIYGIFWELSYHGSPTDVKKCFDDMLKQVEELKNETEILFTQKEIEDNNKNK